MEIERRPSYGEGSGGVSGRGFAAGARFVLWRMPYRIRIDRELCSGYAECVGLAPEVFELDTREKSVVVDPEGTDDETILDAARACPVDAIILIDEYEEQAWPA